MFSAWRRLTARRSEILLRRLGSSPILHEVVQSNIATCSSKMFKPSQPMMARLRLTTKQVNGGYYKGNRTGSMGYFASNGSSYVIDWKKVRTYVVPEHLDQFKLTPFVTKAMAPTRSRYTNEVQKPDGVAKVDRAFNGRDYVDMWSSDNGQEVLEQERLEEEAKAPAPAPAPEAEAEPAQAPAQKRKKTSRQ